ncbi:hypothetical protein NP233_g6015 [Leucocoprinus birnbaumii]|uniref:DUF6532 domain-containing protein n=1 Tax=Leucocoprinus birnbaumii TaxID=56174 RepID=A0AAD5VXL6_9AGAR|nr:hypothetical protein NP233_g6015 [Leucocoprinus birnbaumii]
MARRPQQVFDNETTDEDEDMMAQNDDAAGDKSVVLPKKDRAAKVKAMSNRVWLPEKHGGAQSNQRAQKAVAAEAEHEDQPAEKRSRLSHATRTRAQGQGTTGANSTFCSYHPEAHKKNAGAVPKALPRATPRPPNDTDDKDSVPQQRQPGDGQKAWAQVAAANVARKKATKTIDDINNEDFGDEDDEEHEDEDDEEHEDEDDEEHEDEENEEDDEFEDAGDLDLRQVPSHKLLGFLENESSPRSRQAMQASQTASSTQAGNEPSAFNLFNDNVGVIPARQHKSAARIAKGLNRQAEPETSSHLSAEELDEEEPEIISRKPTAKPSKKNRRKEQQIHDKTVHVQPEASNRHQPVPNDAQPAHLGPETPLPPWVTARNFPGKKPTLQAQHPLLICICHIAIQRAEWTMVTSDAWLECKQHGRGDYHRDILISAAEKVARTDSRALDVIVELQDYASKFAMTIGNMVVDHLSIHRNPAQKFAIDHIAAFQLGVEDQCTEHVKALKVADKYIYPGTWGVEAGQTWTLDTNTATLTYKSSHPRRPEPEMSMTLITLAATGIYSAISSWESGKRVKESFDADCNKPTYDRHIEYLWGMQRDNIGTYHKIMSELFNFATKSQARSIAAPVGSALAIADLADYSD